MPTINYLKLGFIVVIFFAGCLEEATVAKPVAAKTAQVDVVTISPTKWSEVIHAYGIMEAADQVDIAVDFSGMVKAVHFKEGERVERGQLLIEFDESKRKLRLKQAESTVQATRTRLEDARKAVERQRRLFADGNTPRAEYDAAEIALRRAVALFEDAMAAKRLANREFQETRLLSPVTGLVEKRIVDRGETVVPGKLLATIETVDIIRVVTYVSEKEINHLHIGTEAQMTSPGVRGKVYTARIESLGVKADQRTGNFTVKLTLPNDDGLLRSGMTASVLLKGLEIEDAVLIPDTALVDRNRRKVLYIVVDNCAVEVEPVLGMSPGDEVRVIEGIKKGDQLIVAGFEHIVDGSKVIVKAIEK